MEQSVSAIEGVHIEDKVAALALHTRGAESTDAAWAGLRLLNMAAGLLQPDEYRIVCGDEALELIPNVWHVRAQAIAAIREVVERSHRKPAFTVYVGEDVADDDALDAVDGDGVSAVVGRRTRRARYHLDGPDDVMRLIDGLTSVAAL